MPLDTDVLRYREASVCVCVEVESKEKGGTAWNERVRGENAVPMLHQKLMQTKFVQRSRREEEEKKTKQNMPTALSLQLQPFLPVFFILNPSTAPTCGLSDQVAGGAMSSDTFASSHRVPCL